MFSYNCENKLEQLTFRLLVTLGEFLASSLFIYFIAFTFGAYLIENIQETLLFSAIMSSICFMPSFILVKHQSPIQLIDRLLFKQKFESHLEKMLVNLAYGAIIGSWLGALVIPLDWDRWWQEWPISSLIGAALGSFFGICVESVKSIYNSKLHV